MSRVWVTSPARGVYEIRCTCGWEWVEHTAKEAGIKMREHELIHSEILEGWRKE